MPILSLISATAVLVSAGSWAADASRPLEFKFRGARDQGSELSEMLSLSPAPFDAPRALGDSRRRSALDEWTREFCGPNLKLQSGCLVTGKLYGKEKAKSWEPDDRVSEIGDAGDKGLAIVPVPAAAPLLLSALAGLVFASRGRRYQR